MSHTLCYLSHRQQCGVIIISSDRGLVLQSERERESRNIDCFVVSVLGTGLRLFKTEHVQRDSFPITEETVWLSLQRLKGFLSHTCTGRHFLYSAHTVIYLLSLLSCNKNQPDA